MTTGTDVEIHPDLATLTAAITIVDAEHVHVLGAPVTSTAAAATAAAPTGWVAAATSRIEDLAIALYSRCYVRPVGRMERGVVDADREGLFQAALTAAVPSDWVWEQGWHVVGWSDDGRVRVRRHAVVYWTAPDRVRPCEQPDTELTPGPDSRLATGDSCMVRVPRVRRSLLPGFHTIVGAEPGTAEDVSAGLIRLYWHVREGTATALLSAVQSAFDAAAIPFTLKVLRNPVSYVRADAGVLYLPRTRFTAARPALRDVHRRVAAGLRDDTPLLTLRLGRGLGLAEDPGAGTSFGQHRCRIVAEAMWSLYDDGGPDAVASLDMTRAAVAAAFDSRGLDPRTPHLMAGSTIDYSWPRDPSSAPRTKPQRRPPERHTEDDRRTLIAAAREIGRSICVGARWESTGTRCTWIARTISGRAGPGELFVPHSATLGPDLYAGTAGIALFLAQLAALTGDDEVVDTARGALAAALDKVSSRNRSDEGARAGPTGADQALLGLYTGVPGVILAAVRIGRLLGDHVQADHLTGLLDVFLARPFADVEDDLLAGRAGAVLTLLQLAEDPAWGAAEAAAAHARRLGTDLLASVAEHGPAGRRRTPEKPSWTGLSHGVAGVSLALLALARRTGDTAFLEAARAGFEYEDGLFDAEVGNWPDFRDRPYDTTGGPAFMVAWCNGAPGVVLSRLRARDLDPERLADYDRSASAGLVTTLAELRRRSALADWDATLCHGITGLVETLWIGGHQLHRPDLLEPARATAFQLAKHSVTELRSGAPGGAANPSLMLGGAGIGYQLLRIAAPDQVPSVLLGLWDTPD